MPSSVAEVSRRAVAARERRLAIADGRCRLVVEDGPGKVLAAPAHAEKSWTRVPSGAISVAVRSLSQGWVMSSSTSSRVTVNESGTTIEESIVPRSGMAMGVSAEV